MNKIIRIELPTQFGMKTVNAYLLQGKENILIDSGENTDESFEALIQQLSAKCLDVSDIDRIVLTHAHVDHMGMAERIAKAADATVWVSELVYSWAENPDFKWNQRQELMLPMLLSFFDKNTRPLIEQGYQQMMGNVRKVWQAINKKRLHTFSSEGQIELNGEIWDILYMPGHSNTQSTFYNSKTKDYISADMLLSITPTCVIEPSLENPLIREKGILQMIDSYHRLLELEIKTVYPGHYEPFQNAHATINRQLNRIKSRTEECYNIIATGKHSFIDVFNILYKGRVHMPAFIMMIAYLDLLENEGRIQIKEIDGYKQLFVT